MVAGKRMTVVARWTTNLEVLFLLCCVQTFFRSCIPCLLSSRFAVETFSGTVDLLDLIPLFFRCVLCVALSVWVGVSSCAAAPSCAAPSTLPLTHFPAL